MIKVYHLVLFSVLLSSSVFGFTPDYTVSKNMADKDIYHASSNPPRELKWGKRVCYYNCHSLGNDFPWFSNNLEQAEVNPLLKDITVEWTFHNKWYPIEELKLLEQKINGNK